MTVPFTLNCSRVPSQGGLKTFANEIMRSVITLGYPCRAVVPSGFLAPLGVETIPTPASFAGASDLSLLRPLKWLAYCQFRFPVSKSQRILCTTHQVLPGRSRQIVTVHDLRPYFFPDTPVQSYYFRYMLPRLLRRCDGVLTVSETSRQLIAEIYRIPLDRIAVVPNVVESVSLEAPNESPQRFGKPFLLIVGASWPHKNIQALLNVHALWTSRYDLAIVAGRGQYRNTMERLTHTLGIAQHVQFLNDLSPERLNSLYAACAAIVAPSRMEGFGLPPLEAMARCRPVIVADIPVFHELYGEHAVYVRTEDADSWGGAFAALPTVSAGQLNSAQAHAATFTRTRMAASLRMALNTFWNL